MKKTCVKEYSRAAVKTVSQEGITISASVATLQESLQESKRKEAGKPLYLARYE
jgi:hypothetical protein